MSTDAEKTHATDKRTRQKQQRAERLAAEEAARKRAARTQRLALIAGAVVAVGVAALLIMNLVQATDPTLGVDAATSDDTPALSPIPQGAPDPAVDRDAPVVSGYSPDGDEVTIGGSAQAVVFLAHWCPHCQEEAPLIGDWVDEGLLPDGVELVAVSTFHDPARTNWPPDEWLDEVAFPGAVLVDHDDTAAEAWGLTGTPMWVFTDADGTIVARHAGKIDADQFAASAALAAGDEPLS